MSSAIVELRPRAHRMDAKVLYADARRARGRHRLAARWKAAAACPAAAFPLPEMARAGRPPARPRTRHSGGRSGVASPRPAAPAR